MIRHDSRFAGMALIASAMLASASSGWAENVDCTNPQIQIEINYCAEQQALEAEGELAALERRLTSQLDARGKALLDQTHGHWRSYRDSQCQLETLDFQGSMLGSLISECQRRLTEQRTQLVRQMLEAPDAGLSESAPPPSHVWYVILGSFPGNPKGLAGANRLATEIESYLGQGATPSTTEAMEPPALVVSDSNFYPGLTRDLYVVLEGPFPSQQAAEEWQQRAQIHHLVPDVYSKRVEYRPLD